MKRVFAVIMGCLLMAGVVMAQDRKELNSLNMRRAVEAYNNDDHKSAAEYLINEINDNDDNGYAYMMLARIYYLADMYSTALPMVEKAIKYLPKRDMEYLASAYNTRAGIYQSIGEIEKALADYSQCIKLQPEESGFYSNRANLLYNQDRYDEADADYRKMTELNPTDAYAWMGLGRNMKDRERYAEALAIFDKVTGLVNDDYSSVFSFRAECYRNMGRFEEAASDIVRALAIDGDNKAYLEMLFLADSAMLTMTSRLKVQMNKEPNSYAWPSYLGAVYDYKKKYATALEWYAKANTMGANNVVASRMARCYKELALFDDALAAIDKALEEDSTDVEDLLLKSKILRMRGDEQDAIVVATSAAAVEPENAECYYYRGEARQQAGDMEGAMEDFNVCVVLDPQQAYYHFLRGKGYERMGDSKAAMRDYRKAIELDTFRSYPTISHYCHFYLGNEAEARRLCDSMLTHRKEAGYYDAACLYSLMNRPTEAMDYLKRAFESGWCDIRHTELDSDMDNLRNLPQYKDLIADYARRLEQERASVPHPFMADQVTLGEQRVVTVPFSRKGGVTEVKCSINGLPLYFIFDSGASDVSISSVEAAFMIKNGYLTEKDILGKQRYLTANGDVSEGTVINLSSVELGGLTLSNVRASVVKNQKAPLLLGQTVLSRLGKIEIDNANKQLRIVYYD
ncbi:MAG: tetratricopeptide repeat protein [Bacteroidales bacterium]|nr:tetratricopeptide repeat protein [Candidatus Colimorpha onthohippi]